MHYHTVPSHEGPKGESTLVLQYLYKLMSKYVYSMERGENNQTLMFFAVYHLLHQYNVS